MDEFTYTKVSSPHVYYPGNTSRHVWRIEMLDESSSAGFADFFVEDGWSHFLVFYVSEQYRSQEIISSFISNVYQLVDETDKTFWWNALPSMEPYFNLIKDSRPDMTFAASGAINKICHASV